VADVATVQGANVIRKSLAVSAAAIAISSALTGCYVVPIDTRYPPTPGQPVVINSSGATPVAMAAPAPVPTVLQARLYPLNESAGKMGALSATVSDGTNGHATFSLTQGGEVLLGEASRIKPGDPAFGKIYWQVYGDGRMPTGQRGIASAASSQGTYVNCEYVLADAHRGTGACLFSNGAKYQLHFGS
jgi:hypothetical protein